MKLTALKTAVAAAFLSLSAVAFAGPTTPTENQHVAVSAVCDASVSFKVSGSLDENFQKAMKYTTQKVYIPNIGPLQLQRGDYYNEMRPSAIVVSHPYPTKDVGFFKIILQQQNQNTTKVTVYYHQDNPEAGKLLDELKAAVN